MPDDQSAISRVSDWPVDDITICVPASVIVIFVPDCKGLIRFPLSKEICPGSDKTANKSCFNDKALSICFCIC